MSGNAKRARTRGLGRTGIEISPIGLGTWQFAGGKGFDRFVYQGVPDGEVVDIVRTAWAGGVNWFDTAEAYGMGRSERRLSLALGAAGLGDEDVVVATKWFPALRTANSLRTTIVRRRKALSPYGIGLYQIHQPIALSGVKAQMDAMADLLDLGLIRSAGVSNFSARKMRASHAALARRGYPLASNQVKVSLLDRHIERNGVLEAARELGMTVIAWSPLEMGVLTCKFHGRPELLDSRPPGRRAYMRMQIARSAGLAAALEEIADANGVTPCVVALSWVVNFYGDTVVAIPGASRVQQAEQNAMANELKLTELEMRRLDELSAPFRTLLPVKL